MTTAQRRALASYLRETADILGLVEWKIVLLAERPDDAGPGTSGHCRITFGHKHAAIWLEDLQLERPDWQRYIVVHELLHIPMQAPWWVWSRPCEDQLGVPAYAAVAANAVTAWEDTVDHLARAIGPMLPHPNWDADPDPAWIADPDEDGDLVLYSRMYHETGHKRPAS